jgi:hypothetical protein
VLQARRGQRVGKQRRALVGNVPAQQMIEAATVHLFSGQWPRRCHALRQGLLRFLGQQKPAKAACGIGECRGDGMLAVEPDSAARRLRRGARPTVMLAGASVEVVVLGPVPPLVVLTMEWLALWPLCALIRLSLGPRSLTRRPAALALTVSWLLVR